MSEDVLEGTDLAAVVMPEGITGFGEGEVACLLSRHPGDASERSARALHVQPDRVRDDVRRAGLSSLLARGLVQQTAEQFLPRSAAALLDYATGAAHRWTVVEVVHDQASDRVVLLHAPEALALLQPRALGSWFASFTGRVDQPGLLVLELMDAIRVERPGASFRVATETLEDGPADLLLRHDEASGRVEVVDGSGEAGGGRQLLDQVAVPARLERFLR